MAADLKSKFEKAAKEAQSLPSKPDNETLLKLYAYYKQATAGDATGKRPSMFDMVGQAKFDAWSKMKGMAQDAAMKAYVDLVEKLKK